MKTGYCHIYNHRMPLDSITDRLHIGNRWLGHLGLAMYDNTARVHDPVMPRMLTCDSHAVDYPGHSPFSHCARNPANISDKDGNRIKLNSNADDINQTLNLLQNSIGNYYSLSCGDDGIVSWEKGNSSVSIVQKKLVEKLTPMLESNQQMDLNLVNESTDILFGKVRTSTLDIGDILKVTPCDVVSPASILWHELTEQWILQQTNVDLMELDNETVSKAHLKACNIESLISNGKYTYDLEKGIHEDNDNIYYIKYYKPLDETPLYHFINISNGNIDTNRP